MHIPKPDIYKWKVEYVNQDNDIEIWTSKAVHNSVNVEKIVDHESDCWEEDVKLDYTRATPKQVCQQVPTGNTLYKTIRVPAGKVNKVVNEKWYKTRDVPRDRKRAKSATCHTSVTRFETTFKAVHKSVSGPVTRAKSVPKHIPVAERKTRIGYKKVEKLTCKSNYYPNNHHFAQVNAELKPSDASSSTCSEYTYTETEVQTEESYITFNTDTVYTHEFWTDYEDFSYTVQVPQKKEVHETVSYDCYTETDEHYNAEETYPALGNKDYQLYKDEHVPYPEFEEECHTEYWFDETETVCSKKLCKKEKPIWGTESVDYTDYAP